MGASSGTKRDLVEWLVETWKRAEKVDHEPGWPKGAFAQLHKLVKRIGEAEVRRRWLNYLADEFAGYRGHSLLTFATQADRWIRGKGARAGDENATRAAQERAWHEQFGAMVDQVMRERDVERADRAITSEAGRRLREQGVTPPSSEEFRP